MKKLKLYNVTWNEEHAVVVEAENEEEAKEKAQRGYGSDDSVEVSDLQATEMKEIKNNKKCKGCGEDILEGQAVVKGEDRHSACS